MIIDRYIKIYFIKFADADGLDMPIISVIVKSILSITKSPKSILYCLFNIAEFCQFTFFPGEMNSTL